MGVSDLKCWNAPGEMIILGFDFLRVALLLLCVTFLPGKKENKQKHRKIKVEIAKGVFGTGNQVDWSSIAASRFFSFRSNLNRAVAKQRI